jgi:nucleoside-diphosphate-sugar epimerase
MRVLVTGGAGYVGSIVSRLLLEAGYEVRVLDSLLHGGEAVLSLCPFDGFEFVRADIRDAAAVEHSLHGVEAVVHLAAIVGDPACKRDPELAAVVNRDASLRLIGLSADAGVSRFVFASTCSNYGKTNDAGGYVDERADLRPLSVYAETKVAVEQRLLGENDDLPHATVLRFATIFGLSPRPRFDLTVNEFAAELYTKRKLAVFGEQSWRPYLHVADAARAVLIVLEAPLTDVSGVVFNVGTTAENYRKSDLIQLVREQLENATALEVERVAQAQDPRDYQVSFARFESVFGFRASRTVPDGIREVIHALASGIISDYEDPRYRN